MAGIQTSSTGAFGSGLDIQSIVKALVDADSTKLNKLQTKVKSALQLH